MAASMEALGMFLPLHCSSSWAKLIFMSGLDPPSAEDAKIKTSHRWQENTPAASEMHDFLLFGLFNLTFHSYLYHHG